MSIFGWVTADLGCQSDYTVFTHVKKGVTLEQIKAAVAKDGDDDVVIQEPATGSYYVFQRKSIKDMPKKGDVIPIFGKMGKVVLVDHRENEKDFFLLAKKITTGAVIFVGGVGMLGAGVAVVGLETKILPLSDIGFKVVLVSAAVLVGISLPLLFVWAKVEDQKFFVPSNYAVPKGVKEIEDDGTGKIEK